LNFAKITGLPSKTIIFVSGCFFLKILCPIGFLILRALKYLNYLNFLKGNLANLSRNLFFSISMPSIRC